MAENLPPRKSARFRFTSSAGSRAGGGGGGGDGAAAPGSAPRREAPSSPSRSPSPPKPFTYDPDAGSRGDGGGGDSAAAPTPALRRELSSSAPRSPSPSKPFTYDPDAGSRGDGGDGHNPGVGSNAGGDSAAALAPAPRQDPSSPSYDDEEISYSPLPLSPSLSDDEDFDDENQQVFETRNGLGSLFMSDPRVLSTYSSDPENPPHYLGRQNCEPLPRQKFLSLHHNWQQLLDGKKTYLRPPKNDRVAKENYDNSGFVTPKPPESALEHQMPLSDLVRSAARISTIQQKFKILSEYYVCFRPVRSDGSQFYRAFLFSYLENLGKMQGSQAEVTRLMECLRRSGVNFRRLKWNNAYFSNPEAFFSSVVSDFEHLVNSVANGLNADELYKISLQEISSSRILSLLRLLTEVHIRAYEVDYKRAVASQNQNEKLNALLFCKESVRPFGAAIEILQMRALSQVLGIPVHVAVVDSAMEHGTVQVRCLDFVPTSGSLNSIQQYYLSSATDEHPVLPAGNLFSSGRMPLVTIFMTGAANNTGILYRK